MSVDSRPSLRARRASKKEPDRPDYSEPDFSSWAANLADYSPAATSAPAKAPATKAEAATAAVAAAEAVVVVTPTVEAFDDRPSLEEVLAKLLSFDGAMCVAVVDSETGMILGKAGSGVDIDLAAAGASVILRARLGSIKALGDDEQIDDVLISLTSQVQIIHPLPRNPSIFTYLIGDKAKSSLAMARFKAAEADLLIQL
jgi:predicted regulator of Ras-like GTPase activity (Roadblock/LC7/MglB family)